MSLRCLKPGDVLLLLVLAGMTVWLFHLTWARTPGAEVLVRAQGKPALRVPLNRDAMYQVNGELGVSQIQIHQGKVRVAADPGARQICVRQGWLARSGEVALCLANQVSVEILGQSRLHDTVNY